MLEVLAIAPDQIYYLDSAKHRWRRKLKAPLTEAEKLTYERALNFITQGQSLTKLGLSLDRVQESDRLIQFVDEGEALLIAQTLHLECFYFTTGDKRCLKAILQDSQLIDVRDRLAGRVVILESLLLKLIELMGFERVRDQVVPARDCDKQIKVAFGSGLQANSATVREVLEAAIAEIETLFPGFLWS